MADGKTGEGGAGGLRCKPGDLAVFVGVNPAAPHVTGMIVSVVSLAPVAVRFRLPSGQGHYPVGPGMWVIEFANPTDLSALCGPAKAVYAVASDAALRPIRDPGDDATDETLTWLPAPAAQQATRTPAPALNPATAPA